MTETVAPSSLLMGSLFALQQCGLLLEDASILFEAGRHASAIGMALLAREELGRHALLVDLWRKAMTGAAVAMTATEVNAACDDHVLKQERGQKSIVMTGNYGSQLHSLMAAQFASEPGSQEYRQATEQLDKIAQRRQRRQPTDRHERRMDVLYVDMASATDWSRPCEVARDLGVMTCFNEVNQAVNDFSGVRERVLNRDDPPLRGADPILCTAIDALDQVPVIPQPRWPSTESLPESLEREAARGEGRRA